METGSWRRHAGTARASLLSDTHRNLLSFGDHEWRGSLDLPKSFHSVWETHLGGVLDGLIWCTED
jgi:hypothetical protein